MLSAAALTFGLRLMPQEYRSTETVSTKMLSHGLEALHARNALPKRRLAVTRFKAVAAAHGLSGARRHRRHTPVTFLRLLP